MSSRCVVTIARCSVVSRGQAVSSSHARVALLPWQAEALLMQLRVDPARQPRAVADQGGAVPEQPEQLPLVGGPRVGLRDQPREEHPGEEPRVHRITFLRGRGDGPQLLGVGEVEADPGRHQQVIEPGPERARLDHHLQRAVGRERCQWPFGLLGGDGGLQRHLSHPVQHGDGDIL